MENYKYGYKAKQKTSNCATSKRKKSRAEMFFFDALVGLIGSLIIALPVAVWAITTL